MANAKSKHASPRVGTPDGVAWLLGVSTLLVIAIVDFGFSTGLFFGLPFVVCAMIAVLASRIFPAPRRLAFAIIFPAGFSLLLLTSSYATLRQNGVDLIIDGSLTMDGYIYFATPIAGLMALIVATQWVLSGVFKKWIGWT